MFEAEKKNTSECLNSKAGAECAGLQSNKGGVEEESDQERVWGTCPS